MQKSQIPLASLQSPKPALDYRKRSKAEFINFVSEIKKYGNIEPIEVYPLGTNRYYIADGVHRAKAAQLAGLLTIPANIFTDSKPMGQTTPLANVSV